MNEINSIHINNIFPKIEINIIFFFSYKLNLLYFLLLKFQKKIFKNLGVSETKL